MRKHYSSSHLCMLSSVAMMIHNVCVRSVHCCPTLLSMKVCACVHAHLMCAQKPFARHPWLNGSIHTADGYTMALDVPAVKGFVSQLICIHG